MWYVKKESGETYGPVELDTLRHWANDGRVAPNDVLSEDETSWAPAPERPELQMEWLVEFADGTTFGPVNVLALRDPVRDGSILPSATIRNTRTDDVLPLDQALLSALLDMDAGLDAEVRGLHDRVELLTGEVHRLQTATPERAASTGAADAATEVVNARVAEANLEFDRREQELQARIRALEQETESLRRQREAAAAGEKAPGSALDGYSDVGGNYDTLLDELHEKTQELRAAQALRTEIERSAEDRIRHVENLLHQEQDEAQEARTKLAELEKKYYQLVKSYREMNDRLIRSRQPGESHSSKPVPSEVTAKKAATSKKHNK